MQNQRIEKLAAIVINITKVLLIIYLGFEEVFKIIKSLQKLLDDELDFSLINLHNFLHLVILVGFNKFKCKIKELKN